MPSASLQYSNNARAKEEPCERAVESARAAVRTHAKALESLRYERLDEVKSGLSFGHTVVKAAIKCISPEEDRPQAEGYSEVAKELKIARGALEELLLSRDAPLVFTFVREGATHARSFVLEKLASLQVLAAHLN